MIMNRYSFDTHYGKSTVVDLENLIAVTWDNGRFNETSRIEYTGDSKDALEIAHIARELADYVVTNHPELV